MPGEQARHFFGRLQMAIGEALAAKADLVDGAAFADAGQHILQHAPLRRVIEHVAGRDGRHARGAGSGSASRCRRTASFGRRRKVSAR